jgi:hypothetical protein
MQTGKLPAAHDSMLFAQTSHTILTMVVHCSGIGSGVIAFYPHMGLNPFKGSWPGDLCPVLRAVRRKAVLT